MPDILDPITRMQADALTALAWVLYPLLGILLAHQFGPGLAERYRLRTKAISERDADRAVQVIKKLNGTFLAELADSVGFQEIVDKRTEAKIRYSVAPRLDSLEEWKNKHDAEDGAVHERVRGLEVEVKDIRGDIGEIKRGQERLSQSIETKWNELKDALHAAQMAIVNQIHEVASKK